MKKSLVQKLGLLGVVSFLSYALAVIFSPLAYPGYHPLVQAVSDLSAADAPSLALSNQLSAGYNACEVVCATIVCVGIQGQKTKLLRAGIYLFAIMEWISALGYRMFPLSTSGCASTFQDVMHLLVTALVVLLSAVQMFRASGAMELLTGLLSPVLEGLGIPPETAVLLLVRPVSGSGALAVGSQLMEQYGPDSYIGRVTAVMLGCSETTFYTVAVYYGAAGIRRTRHTVPAALAADAAAFIAAAWAVRVFFP